MNMENLLKTSDIFSTLKVEKILFEAEYPILFSCIMHNDVYIFICHECQNKSIKWIASKTTYSILIKLLEDKITIREAFLRCSDRKLLIEYHEGIITISDVLKEQVPDSYLPTDGEYMDSEVGEFDDEIKYYSFKNQKRKELKEHILFESFFNDNCDYISNYRFIDGVQYITARSLLKAIARTDTIKQKPRLKKEIYKAKK